VGEVFLFDVGLVGRFVSAGAGLFDTAVAPQEIGLDDFVEESAAVGAVESEHGKGQAFLDALKAGTHFAAAVAPERGELGPAAVEVGERQAWLNAAAAKSAE